VLLQPGGGRAKGVHICIIKVLTELYQAQSQMHAQQAQDVPLNQMEVVNASLAIAAWQGTNTQVGAPKEGGALQGWKMGPNHLMHCSCCLICRMMVHHPPRSR
jgi:hypothetical protein